MFDTFYIPFKSKNSLKTINNFLLFMKHMVILYLKEKEILFL